MHLKTANLNLQTNKQKILGVAAPRQLAAEQSHICNCLVSRAIFKQQQQQQQQQHVGYTVLIQMI